MLSTAKSANIGFLQVVQLFAHPQTLHVHFMQKIAFINLKKKFLGVHNVRTNIRV